VRAKALEKTVLREKSALERPTIIPEYVTVYPIANNDEQMQSLVKEALQSEQTMAAILSLIARSNEANLSPSSAPQESSGDSNGASQQKRTEGSQEGDPS
jgi:hypothetical protein